jgi:hypothetical protein
MEQFLQKFKMTKEKFIEHKNITTESIKKYYLSEIDIIHGKENGIPKHLEYLNKLDLSYDEYLEFGADKCGFDDFIKFCEEVNIDFLENISRIKSSTEKRNFHFYSRDKKITLTCHCLGNYVHYFGITGEYNVILSAFEYFNKRTTHSELCWGGRDFI